MRRPAGSRSPRRLSIGAVVDDGEPTADVRPTYGRCAGKARTEPSASCAPMGGHGGHGPSWVVGSVAETKEIRWPWRQFLTSLSTCCPK